MPTNAATVLFVVRIEQKLSCYELAQVFGVHVVTIQRWCKRRGLPHRKTLGGGLRFSPREVLAFLRTGGHHVPDELVRLVEGNEPLRVITGGRGRG